MASASNDIGIDLGTATVIIYDPDRGLLLKEPSVVAINKYTGDVLAVGEEASAMLGRTPDRIQAVMPLSDGVISDFEMTSAMIKAFIKKVYNGSMIKPRVAICVPSGITGVESKAVVSAAVDAGARKVYLIEEPVAAAIGAGIDISKPEGRIIVDIGGGTTDIAVLSFNGIVCKASVKTAGRKLDEAIVRYVRNKYGVLIGEKMAEKAKITAGSVCYSPEEEMEFELKGRDLKSGMPCRQIITRREIKEAIAEQLDSLVEAILQILEITPPELSADIYHTGVLLTGGGALLHGIDLLLAKATGLKVIAAEDPTNCVAIGTAMSFKYLGQLYDGFVNPTTHSH